MQDLSRWGDWWDPEELQAPDYSAHVRAAKATLHEQHVKDYRDYRLDQSLAAKGLVRVKPTVRDRSNIVVQPSFSHIPPLSFSMRIRYDDLPSTE
jgi:hypothetical protein